MKIIIAGSRGFVNYKIFKGWVDYYLSKTPDIKIISGGAIGTDTLAERYAKENNYPLKVYYPDWSIGKQAGMIRNEVMAINADAAIIFWDGKSPGTKGMIDVAARHKLPCRVIKYNEHGVKSYNASSNSSNSAN